MTSSICPNFGSLRKQAQRRALDFDDARLRARRAR